MKPNCVLFIPVSSPSGIGEYMRSLIIAEEMSLQWPELKVHFILNSQVDYVKDCPYEVHTCPHSPTKDIKVVNKLMRKIKPDLVIFDASGRAAHFKQAKAIGAKVAFISQHSKKRRRGLKLNRLLNTDIHWVAQPDYCISPLSLWQKAKLHFFKKAAPKNIGPVFHLNNIEFQTNVLKKFCLTENNYFIFNAGSGGHLIDDSLAADIYYQAAKVFSKKTQIKCIVIFGSNYPNSIPNPSLDHCLNNNQKQNINALENTKDVICVKSIDNSTFIALINAAQGCVVSAGDTILQCISLHKLIVAAPVSSDQPARLTNCSNKNLVLAAKPNHKDIVRQALRLINKQDKIHQVLQHNISQQAPINGLAIIINDITSLFDNGSKDVMSNTIN